MQRTLVVLALLAGGCVEGPAQFAAAPGQAAGEPPQKPGGVTRKVVLSAALDLTVTDIEAVRPEVERLTSASGGTVEQSVSNVIPGGTRSTSWTLRIPAARFNDTLDQLAKLGTATRTSTGAEDVTVQFIDVQARIDNLQKQEDALNRLLGQTKSEETVLKIQDLVRKVRTELDSAQGQKNYLDRAVDLGKLTVTARESTRYTPPGAATAGFGERAGRTLNESARSLVEFGVNAALVCVALLPWLPLIALGVLILRWGTRRLLRVVRRQVAWLLSPVKPPPDPFASPFSGGPS